MLPNAAVAQFNRDGFIVVRSVFAREEVANLRSAIVGEAERAQAQGRMLKSVTGEVVPVGDLLGRAGIGELVFDRRLLDIARSLIGRDEIVYFGDSGLMVGGALRGFHKDNTVRDDGSHSDWKTAYTLVRFGLYLQDHAKHSGGLKVRRGSHMHPDISSGRIVDVPTRAGDVVVWSLRTTHSGHTVRLRGIRRPPLQPRFEFRLPSIMRTPEEVTRVAAFITYGVDDNHLRNYIDRHANLRAYPENYLYKSWLYSYAGDDVKALAARRGCKLVTPIGDYGTLFASRTCLPHGFVPTLPPKRDVFKPHGMEAWIQRFGRGLRAIRRVVNNDKSLRGQ